MLRQSELQQSYKDNDCRFPRHVHNILSKTPQTHRIVRYLDRTIGCDWAKVRSIGNVCYDLQQRARTATDLYAWSRYEERFENTVGKSHCIGNRVTGGSDQRPMYDQS